MSACHQGDSILSGEVEEQHIWLRQEQNHQYEQYEGVTKPREEINFVLKRETSLLIKNYIACT